MTIVMGARETRRRFTNLLGRAGYGGVDDGVNLHFRDVLTDDYQGHRESPLIPTSLC